MRYLTLLLIGYIAGSISAIAHQDDAGDIHPMVRIENHQFAVYFRNNIEKQTYKSLIAANGTALSMRQKSQPPSPIARPVPLAEELEGINVPTKGAFYVFPEWERKHKGSPFMVQIVDQKVKKIPLAWGGAFISIVHAAAISDEAIVLTTSPKEPKEAGSEFPFTFHSFDPKSFKKLHSTNIGTPIRVYWFPMASNVILESGHAYVAWMGVNGSLNLTRFDPLSGRCETRKISRGWGNSSPSIGVIGDEVLICFHRRGDLMTGGSSHQAEIAYEHRVLSTLFEKNNAAQGDADQSTPAPKSEGNGKPKSEVEAPSR